jgi:hypothetical protein
MKKICFFLLFVTLCLSLPVLVKRSTHGFQLRKLTFDPPYNCAWEGATSKEEEQRARELLGQTFFYIGRGSQAYAFASQDGKFILKLFRSDLKTHLWDRSQPVYTANREKVERLFRAAILAYTKGSDLTGLVYLHLNPTQETLPTTQIKDRWGRGYCLDLNRYAFALQYKGHCLEEAFRNAFQKGDQVEAKQLIDSFLELLKIRVERLIRNVDRSVFGNFGFLQGRALEWDFGNYRSDPTLAQEEAKKGEMAPFLLQLRRFLEKEGPEWLDYYDLQIASLSFSS